jgi:L-iditol 2-dehydrogenase
MKAATFMGPGEIGIADYDRPEPPPAWVRIGISAAGICGTDLHFLEAKRFANNGIRPGHEVAGIIDAVGDDVDMETGTLVTVEPVIGCGECHPCGTGFPNRCPDFRLFGLSEPGGLAEYLNVPAQLVHPLPADLSPEIGALTEPMAVCSRGIRRGQVAVGNRVAILGAGAVGLQTLIVARAAGAGEVFVTARYPRQAELARHLGATAVFPDGQALFDAVGNQTVDVVIETVGSSADTLTEAVRVARPGGRIVMLGIFDDSPSIPGLDFAVRELTLVGSSCYGRENPVSDFALAARLVSDHRDTLSELVSHRFSLDQVTKAFATAADKSSGAIKVEIIPGA